MGAKALPGIDWTMLQRRYIEGVPLMQLAKVYGVKPGTICQRAKRGKWRVDKLLLAEKIEKATQAAFNEAIAEKRPEITGAIERWTSRSHAIAGKLVEQVGSIVEGEVQPEKLMRLAGALERADVVGRRALGMDSGVATGADLNATIGLQFSASRGLAVCIGVTSRQPHPGQPDGACDGLSGDYGSDASVVDVDSAPVANPYE
jgi:hypothetical protein